MTHYGVVGKFFKLSSDFNPLIAQPPEIARATN